MTHLPEEHESLWLLTAAPVIWAAHFLLCYLTAAIWCAKLAGPDGSLGERPRGDRRLHGRRARRHRDHRLARAAAGTASACETVPHDFDTPEDRHRFLGFATLLLSGLSAVATLYAALAAVFIGSCH